MFGGSEILFLVIITTTEKVIELSQKLDVVSIAINPFYSGGK